MKKSFKRFLPFVIVLALCMSLFTVSAFAVDKRNPTVQPTEDGKAWEAVDKDGKVIRNGWLSETDPENAKNQTWYYASKGELVTGWQKIDGDWYYFGEPSTTDKPAENANGVRWIDDGKEPETSQQWLDQKDLWYFNKDGSLYSGDSGWVSQLETWGDRTYRVWYFVNSDGSLYKGWVEDDGNLYAVDPAMETGIQTGYTYPGFEVDEWTQGTTWAEVPHHFINKDGTTVTNGWASVNWTNPETEESGRDWYYADSNGELVTGWNEIDGKWYFFGSPNPDEPGYNWMQQDSAFWIDGVRYYVDKSGARAEGWVSYKTEGTDDEGNVVTGRGWAYFEPDTGAQAWNGWKKIDGKWYIFSQGEMAHDTPVMYDGKEYYLGTDGAMVTGWVQDAQGEWYNYGDDGALKTDTWIEDDNGSWYYVDNNGEMARNTEIDGYYVGNDGAWIPD
jgi:glucan-binding YG repeat protein